MPSNLVHADSINDELNMSLAAEILHHTSVEYWSIHSPKRHNFECIFPVVWRKECKLILIQGLYWYLMIALICTNYNHINIGITNANNMNHIFAVRNWVLEFIREFFKPQYDTHNLQMKYLMSRICSWCGFGARTILLTHGPKKLLLNVYSINLLLDPW